MKILLVKSDSSSPSYLSSCAPPLGIMYIASYLREYRKGKDKISILDMYVSKIELEDFIRDFSPDLVGISSMTTEAEKMFKICSKIKQINRNITVVAGGPHVSGYLYQVMDNKNIDFAVPYEGEESFLELVESLDTGKINDIQGVAIRNNGVIYFKPRALIENLDSIPFPAYDLIDLEAYTKYRSQLPFRIPEKYALLFTSRGCPFRCIYCSTPFGKAYREHSPERVLSEIKKLYFDFSVKNFLVADDIFNLREKRVNEILDLIISSGLEIRLFFTGGLRLDLINNKETIYKLKQAGTVYISFGFETSSPRLQKIIKRNLNIKKVEENIKIIDELGIYSLGTFMFGLPHQTEKDIIETIKWAISRPITNAMFFIANPLGGSELANMSKEKIKYKSFDDFGHFISKVNVSDISKWRLYIFQIFAYLVFYTSPKKILRIIKLFPFSKSFLIENVFGFVKFLVRMILNAFY